jgi:hypothetical protein
VVVERAERQQLGERGQSADVVAVPMADDHVVDARQVIALLRRRCASRRGRRCPGSGIEQQRLSVGRGEERGRPDIDQEIRNDRRRLSGTSRR